MRTILLLLTTCSYLSLFCYSAKAQSGSADAELVRFDFKTILLGRMGEDTPKRLYHQQGLDYKPITFSYQNMGLKHSFAGTWPFHFYEKVETDEGPVMRAYATINEAPPKVSNIFLLVIPREKAIQSVMLAADKESLPSGHLRVLNLSNSEIVLGTGAEDTLIRIKPGKTEITEYEVDGERFAFNLKVAAANESGWRMVHSSMVTQVNEDPLFAVVSGGSAGNERLRVRFLNLASF